MKTKQIITLAVILVVGILIGKFAFSNSGNTTANTHQNETVVEHWTCSMHPQIDMPEPGQCPICGMDLILKTASTNEGLSANAFKMTKNAIALANIETVVVGETFGSNEAFLNISGKIMANENATALQTAHFGGRIEKLYYKSVGEYIKQGTLIASVYSPELVTAQNELLEAMKVKELQPELYQAVRNKIKLWKISEKQIQQIERTKKVITYFNMYANVSGHIESVLVQEGNHIKEGTPMFKVAKLQTIWAVFDVYEKDVKKMQLKQEITVILNAYPDKKIKAKIDFIEPTLNVKTRTVEVRATLKNFENRIKPGMLIVGKVQLKNNKKNRQISIPKTAVLWTGKRSIVYVKTNKDTPVFELRKVTLGTDLGDAYEIISGLTLGEEVVSNGAFTVDASAQLQGKKSMMSPQENSKEDQKGLKKISVNPIFKSQINTIFNSYLEVKNGLVADDLKIAAQKAQKGLKDLEKVSMSLLKKPEAHTVWMKELPKIKTAFKQINQVKTIEKQRKQFIKLSKSIIILTSIFGVNDTLYISHCPMANENKGANWLSEIKEIKNPFFGSKMLTCGNVKKTLSK